LKKNPMLMGRAIFRMCDPMGPEVSEADFIHGNVTT